MKLRLWVSVIIVAVLEARQAKGVRYYLAPLAYITFTLSRITYHASLVTYHSCFIALSIAAKSCPMVASVSSPILETRNVVPLIFP